MMQNSLASKTPKESHSGDLKNILSQLRNVKKSGSGWTAQCPAHDDKRNSLSINESIDDKLLLHCHAGCTFESIIARVELNPKEFSSNKPRIVATYDYRDENGALLYQSVRFDPKDFRQRKPDGNGGWTWKLDDVRRVLYRLPELIASNKSETVFIVEGEKDVDRLFSLGLVATCNVSGAGKWRDDYNEHLRGRDVVIIPDNDEHGKKHTQSVAASLHGIASSVKVIALSDLPEKGDVSDWLGAGNTKDDLISLVEASQIWKPSQPKKQKAKLQFTTLDDLLAEPEEKVSWVWDKTLPSSGFSICAAKPKVGKSTLARNLAVAVMRGDDFFGRATTQGRILYLCMEEKRAEVAKHFKRMGASGKDLMIHTGNTGENRLDELEQAIKEFQPVLIILDPLARFARIADFNDYAKVNRELEPIVDLVRETSCHILAVHHDGKGEREGGDSLLGSTAFFGIVDALLKMKRREFGRTLETVQRYGEDLPETICYLNKETGIVSPQGDVQSHKLEDRKKQVLESFSNDEELTENDLKERIGGEGGLTAKAIRELYNEGKLTRTGEGKRGHPYLYGKTNTDSKDDNKDSRFLGLSNIENPTNLENLERNNENKAALPLELMFDENAANIKKMLREVSEDESFEIETIVNERAAIMEFDGELSHDEANHQAELITLLNWYNEQTEVKKQMAA